MKVIDPGHLYLLESLDGDFPQELRFVKREGEHYPGNVGAYPGTTMQEVCRAMINRCQYTDNQIACMETELAAELIRGALTLFEMRAARVHSRELMPPLVGVEQRPTCKGCGHVTYEGCR
jgi:hypothetical protein